MRVGLHITTYNSEATLERVLVSVAAQVAAPDEVLVLDDGSLPATAKLVASMRHKIRGIRHMWQEDLGFRLARLRNLGVLCSTTDYIISVDGDMVLHSNFVRDHVDAARRGYFIQGVRQRLSSTLTERLLADRRSPKRLECLLGRDDKNKSRLLGVRCVWASKLFSAVYEQPRKIMGCNQSFYREDLFAVNGYSNTINGWGEEDYDLAIRMCKSGVRETHLRYRAIAWHLYHLEKERVNARGAEPESTCSADGLRELRNAITGGDGGQITCDGAPLTLPL